MRIAARVKQRGHDVPRADALRALDRAARKAREVARMHGTPIYVMKDGKVVALKP